MKTKAVTKKKPEKRSTAAALAGPNPAPSGATAMTITDRKTGESLHVSRPVPLKICGIDNHVAMATLVGHAMNTVPDSAHLGADKLAITATEVLGNIAPANALEGMLATQLLIAHNAAAELLRRGLLPDQDIRVSESRIASAGRLMRQFGEHVETLQRLRGKTTKQTVIVEHVHVGAGGQAVVGAIAGPGGGGGGS